LTGSGWLSIIQRDGWRSLPWIERERLALELLGPDRLVIRELLGRFREQRSDLDTYESDIRSVLHRLLEAREVDRKPEPRVPGGKAIRYRYFRRKLDGPIVDLERAFHETPKSDGEGSV
jgi:hypothetical protein